MAGTGTRRAVFLGEGKISFGVGNQGPNKGKQAQNTAEVTFGGGSTSSFLVFPFVWPNLCWYNTLALSSHSLTPPINRSEGKMAVHKHGLQIETDMLLSNCDRR